MPPKSDSPLDSPPPYDDSDAGGVNNDHSDGENSSHPSMPSLVSISDDDSNHGIDDITARLQTMSTTPRAPRAMLNSTNGAPRRARDFLADSASELNGPHRASARLARRALNAALVDRLNNPLLSTSVGPTTVMLGVPVTHTVTPALSTASSSTLSCNASAGSRGITAAFAAVRSAARAAVNQQRLEQLHVRLINPVNGF
ncbi:hypothetical protein R3P38DRAFT_2804338 [Favolaschia claudopus]|uniref:Uncharacterized protein n=1 Tax=Favolaschia claudopus TaxID=2862362 RepID=A0AAV9ZR09_9AGAR